jgi:hypothetical protein
LELIWSGDANLFAIVGLSLFVTLSATFVASVVGMPLGALVALTRFPGRNALIVFLNGCMGAATGGRWVGRVPRAVAFGATRKLRHPVYAPGHDQLPRPS